MYSLKFATRVQVILLILSLAFSILFWFSACIGKGLGDKDYLIDATPIFLCLSFCVIMVLVLKLFLLKNNYILPIGGIIVFIGFMVGEQLRYINYLNYRPASSSFDYFSSYFHLNIFSSIYLLLLLLLLVNSIGYLVLAIKAH